jgi:hypothetical protein
VPLLDGKLQFRVKARYLDISAGPNDDWTDDLEDSRFGDTDIPERRSHEDSS